MKTSNFEQVTKDQEQENKHSVTEQARSRNPSTRISY